MTIQRYDGSIQSNNTPTSLNRGEIKDYAIYRCMVIDVQYVDKDENNNTNAQNPDIEYSCMVLGGFKEGQVISNVRMTKQLGGNLNYQEIVLKKSTKTLIVDDLNKHDGDIVYVQFLQGNPAFPVIIALGMNHQDKDKTGSIESTGPRFLNQYNGILTHINKSGEISWTRKGGSYSETDGFFTPADETEDSANTGNNTTKAIDHIFEAEMEWKDNQMLWRDNQSSIKFEQTEKKWTHRVGKDGGGNRPPDSTANVYEEVIDGTAETTTRTYKSGLVIVENGKADSVTITTANGDLVDIKSGDITIKESGGGELRLNGGKVALGKNGGDELLSLLEDLCDKLNVAKGNLGYVLDNAADYATIKGKITAIKATL